MTAVTSRHMECTLLTRTTVGCLPLRYNGDPDKEATSPPMWLDANVFSQAAEAIVESPSPEPQERLPIDVLTDISFTSAGKLISLSLIDGGESMLQPLQLRCIHAQLSRQCDLATKCHISMKDVTNHTPKVTNSIVKL